MIGPEHYRESERLIAMCVDADGNPPSSPTLELDLYLRLAQVHATLALAAAVALGQTGMRLGDYDPWVKAASAMDHR